MTARRPPTPSARVLAFAAFVPALLASAGAAFAQGEVSPCGGPDQRACCLLERVGGACDPGLAEVAGCDDDTNGDCTCTGGRADSSSHCEAVTPCGGENERACCFLERLPSCDPGLVEIPWCAGDCLCTGIAGTASGTCVAPTPCGGRGQRACCIDERAGGACDAGLIEVPGCSGDCFCGGGGGGNTSSGMCTVMEAMDEPSSGWTPPEAAPECPLHGYADMHLHMFGSRAHGGGLLAGKAYDPVGGVNAALAQDFGTFEDLVTKSGAPLPSPPLCPWYLPNCGDRLFHGDHVAFFDDAVGYGTQDNTTSNLGAPIFSGWPTWHTTTHQQSYYKWLERAWRGGLRMTVMLAVSNEALCRSNRHLRDTNCFSSMQGIDAQLDDAYAFQAFLDQQSGGWPEGWFRIVTTPRQAREAMIAGKLAVMLGIEVDNLFDCHDADRQPGGRCGTRDAILAKIDEYYDRGVRYVFPIHNFDNSFGGPATWQTGINLGNRAVELHWWEAENCPPGYGFKLNPDFGSGFMLWLMGVFGFGISEVPLYDALDTTCNARGLTPQGEWLLTGLMDKGMLIDVDHMSRHSIDATLELAESRAPRYPLVASHVLPFDMHTEAIRHERMRTREQLERIRDGGGLVAMMLKDDVQDTDNHGRHYSLPYEGRGIPDDCRHSTKSWAQSYLYLADLMGGPVAMGSDFNGVAGHVGPRFGSDACGGDRSNGGVGLERSTQYRTSARTAYPFTLPGFGTFGRQVTGDKTFDFNVDGMAHVGMLPDFVADLSTIGMTDADLAPLMRSAEELVRVWERASAGAPLTATAAACEHVVVAADDTCRATASVAAAGVDGDATVSLTQSPAGPYALGQTQVTLHAQPTLTCDGPTSCEATVTVADATAPTITCPADRVVECTGSATPASFDAPTVADNCGPMHGPFCSVLSGAGFPLGATEVDCLTTDGAGNQADCGFEVRVVDTTLPAIAAPADLPAVECASPGGTAVALGAPTVSDACDGAPAVTNDAPAVFPARQTTTVIWTATDASGNASSDAQAVTVVDTARPAVSCSVNGAALLMPWPPNHELVNVSLAATAADACDGALPVGVSVFANEDDETLTAPKDGLFSPDARDLAAGTLRLRQERVALGQGRTYLVVAAATDAAGNTGAACCAVAVPKSQKAAAVAGAQRAAEAARLACEAANGTPPPGFVPVGDGPTIGPKQ